MADGVRYELEVEDTFDSDTLDERLWLPLYLPHWSGRATAGARYDVGGGSLRLRIDEDTPPWAPDLAGGLRVSALQTGSFSGPAGSPVGQHRFREGLVVREAQPRIARYSPKYGRFEMRARAIADAASLVALWMIGFEEAPEQSAEICVFEIFGRDVDPAEARIGMGVHPFGDPAIRDDFTAQRLAIDAREPHTYAAEWTPGRVVFSVDRTVAKAVRQSPAYPMQLMLTLYEFSDGPEPPSPPDAYPKTFVVESFRGYRPVSGPGARPPAVEAATR